MKIKVCICILSLFLSSSLSAYRYGRYNSYEEALHSEYLAHRYQALSSDQIIGLLKEANRFDSQTELLAALLYGGRKDASSKHFLEVFRNTNLNEIIRNEALKKVSKDVKKEEIIDFVKSEPSAGFFSHSFKNYDEIERYFDSIADSLLSREDSTPHDLCILAEYYDDIWPFKCGSCNLSPRKMFLDAETSEEKLAILFTTVVPKKMLELALEYFFEDISTQQLVSFLESRNSNSEEIWTEVIAKLKTRSSVRTQDWRRILKAEHLGLVRIEALSQIHKEISNDEILQFAKYMCSQDYYYSSGSYLRIPDMLFYKDSKKLNDLIEFSNMCSARMKIDAKLYLNRFPEKEKTSEKLLSALFKTQNSDLQKELMTLLLKKEDLDSSEFKKIFQTLRFNLIVRRQALNYSRKELSVEDIRNFTSKCQNTFKLDSELILMLIASEGKDLDYFLEIRSCLNSENEILEGLALVHIQKYLKSIDAPYLVYLKLFRSLLSSLKDSNFDFDRLDREIQIFLALKKEHEYGLQLIEDCIVHMNPKEKLLLLEHIQTILLRTTRDFQGLDALGPYINISDNIFSEFLLDSSKSESFLLKILEYKKVSFYAFFLTVKSRRPFSPVFLSVLRKFLFG